MLGLGQFFSWVMPEFANMHGKHLDLSAELQQIFLDLGPKLKLQKPEVRAASAGKKRLIVSSAVTTCS